MSRTVPGFGTSVAGIASLAFMRTRRSRRALVGLGALAVLVVAVAASRTFGTQTATDAWDKARELAVLGFAGYFLPYLLLASSISDEVEERTITYSLVRPVSRSALVLGRYVVGVLSGTLVGLVFAVALFAASFASEPRAADGMALAWLVPAFTLLVAAHGAMAMAATAAAPRAAASVTVGLFLLFELLPRMLPGVMPLASMQEHASQLAGLPTEEAHRVSRTVAAVTMLAVTGFYLGIAMLAAGAREYRDEPR